MAAVISREILKASFATDAFSGSSCKEILIVDQQGQGREVRV